MKSTMNYLSTLRYLAGIRYLECNDHHITFISILLPGRIHLQALQYRICSVFIFKDLDSANLCKIR